MLYRYSEKTLSSRTIEPPFVPFVSLIKDKNKLRWECNTQRYKLSQTDNQTDKMLENYVILAETAKNSVH